LKKPNSFGVGKKRKKLWLKNPNSFLGAKEGENCSVMVEKT